MSEKSNIIVYEIQHPSTIEDYDEYSVTPNPNPNTNPNPNPQNPNP